MAAGSTIRVGSIGAGFGQAVHVPAFARHPRCAVTMCCARRLTKAQAVAQQHGIPQALDTWRDVISSADCDAIAIAVPPTLQPTIVLAAAAEGKHVFCEKPVADSVSAATAMLHAVREAGIAHVVDFEFLAQPYFERARALLQTQAIGRLRHMSVSWHVETYAARSGQVSWKTRTADGGGALHLFGSHVVSYIEWLCGPVTLVQGTLHDHCALADGEPHESLVQMSLEAAGVPITAAISTHAIAGTGHAIEIYGDEGSILLHNDTAQHLSGFTLQVRRRGVPTEMMTPPIVNTEQDDRVIAVGSLIDRFVHAIDTREPVMPDLETGWRVQRVLDAVRQSAVSHVPVQIPHVVESMV